MLLKMFSDLYLQLTCLGWGGFVLGVWGLGFSADGRQSTQDAWDKSLGLGSGVQWGPNPRPKKSYKKVGKMKDLLWKPSWKVVQQYRVPSLKQPAMAG